VYIPSNIKPAVEEFEGGRGRFYMERSRIDSPDHIEPETSSIQETEALEETIEKDEIRENTGEVETEKEGESLTEDDHLHDATIDVQGFMTLKEVAENYQVPVEHIKSKLEIPQSVSENERLGRLRRTYGFTMSDVRDIIIEYKQNKM
jgi:hypothetical protein